MIWKKTPWILNYQITIAIELIIEIIHKTY